MAAAVVVGGEQRGEGVESQHDAVRGDEEVQQGGEDEQGQDEP